MRIDQKFWKDAEDVQDACNMSGILISFLAAVRAMRKAGFDGNAINGHPVTRAFADKVASLACVQILGNDNALDAHTKVWEENNGTENKTD